MHQLEREKWLSKFLQEHTSSILYLFIFIHSVMSENDKKVPSIIFTRNEVCGTHLVFQKRRFQGFIFESLSMIGSHFLSQRCSSL